MAASILTLTGASWGTIVATVAQCLDQGGITLLPAEGVYGFHARPDRPEAVSRLSMLKEAEKRLGFIALIARPEHWIRLVDDPLPLARQLVAAHWPGALTLVLPTGRAARRVYPHFGATIALRCPGSALLRDVTHAAGVPLLSTSANQPGRPAPSRFREAWLDPADLGVDAGPLAGLPSTLARVSAGSLEILRPGAVTLEGPHS